MIGRGISRLLPPVEQGSGIPKVIYQTDSRGILPDDLRSNQERLLKLNPGWVLQHFNNDQREHFIESEYGIEICSIYRSIDASYGASRADLFRYLLIYKRGGAYLDVKSSSSVSFDAMLSPGQTIVLAKWDQADEETKGWGEHPELTAAGIAEFQQWHIIAAKGHPYLRHVIIKVISNIRTYVAEIHGVGRQGVYRLTGPIAYSLAIADCLKKIDVSTNKEIGLIYSIYDSTKRHRTLNGAPHYSTLTTPIISPDMKKKAIGRVFRIARKIRDFGHKAARGARVGEMVSRRWCVRNESDLS